KIERDSVQAGQNDVEITMRPFPSVQGKDPGLALAVSGAEQPPAGKRRQHGDGGVVSGMVKVETVVPLDAWPVRAHTPCQPGGDAREGREREAAPTPSAQCQPAVKVRSG